MSASNELYAHLLEEALKAVRAGVASVEAQSTPNLQDFSTYEAYLIEPNWVFHKVTVEWTEYLNEKETTS